MKYCLIIPDGLADYTIEKLSGRTPVEAARTPNLDFLAQNGQLGTVRPIPGGFPPGSDVANLTIVGYDPKVYYSGRAPLEAASIGIKLNQNDWAFRCNLITASEDILEDFYTGKSYRHIMVYRGTQQMDAKCFPPHDIMGQSIEKHLPRGHGGEILIDLMNRSREILAGHEINKVRIDLKENPANMIWLWGQGHRPNMPT